MKFQPISFWMEDAKPVTNPLEGHLDVDIVIVGAGFTGLSSAIFLARAGHNVAVLEEGVIGNGASGRNCGQIGTEIGRNLLALTNDLGSDGAGQVLSVLRASISHLENLIAHEGIDCSYNNSGNIFAGVHSKQMPFIKRVAAIAHTHGFPARVFGEQGAGQLGIPKSIVCGFHDQTGGTLNPAQLVQGMAKVALGTGRVQIFENTPVLAIDGGEKVTVKTEHGTITAPTCVLATNAYTPNLGFLKRRILPAHVSVAVTRPLTDLEIQKIGWTGPSGLYTAHNIIENLRLTPDRRILVGTKKVRVGFGARVPKQNDPKVFSALQQVLKERFPELPNVEIEQGWTGRVGVTSDSVPLIGRLGNQRNILFSVGYSGHGVAMAAYAGHQIAALHSKNNLGPASILEDRWIVPVPPEPFRWLGANLLFQGMRRKDTAMDRAARALP